MDLISVIVPVYKVEEYLEQCILSICNQSYKNLEILLVDDGSPDQCPAICDKWAKKDARIRVIHKKNGGLSDARNVGIEYASGKYIAFVDSDDWIDTNLYELLLYEMQKNNAQIAACKIIKAYEEHFEEQKIISSQKVFSCEEALQTLLRGQDFCAVAWNKLYRRDIIGDIRFPVGKLHEDEFFTYRVISHASKLILVSEGIYYYRQRPGSIMDTWSIKHLDALDAFHERLSFLKENYPNLYYEDKFNFYMACVYNARELLKCTIDDTVIFGIKTVLHYSMMIHFSLSELLKLGLKKTVFTIRGRKIFWKLSRRKR